MRDLLADEFHDMALQVDRELREVLEFSSHLEAWPFDLARCMLRVEWCEMGDWDMNQSPDESMF